MRLETAGRSWSFAVAAAMTIGLTMSLFISAIPAGSAFAYGWGREQSVALKGEWAPFNRCPVDDPTMLAANGPEGEALCVADTTPSGSMTIGNMTVAFNGTNHQFGVVLNENDGSSTVAAPKGGVLRAEPVELPNGIQELLCPSRAAWQVCRDSHGYGWYAQPGSVTWTLESAGTPYEFELFAGLFERIPFAWVPLRVHLQSPLLGDDCYIGSEAEPILTHPANLSRPVAFFAEFNAAGEPVKEGETIAENEELVELGGVGTEGSTSFSVPAAIGCGPRGIYDLAIDSKVGLPSSATTNSLTFNETTSRLTGFSNPVAVAPNDGAELAKDWHAAVVPSGDGHGGHGHRWYGSRVEVERSFRHWFGWHHQ